MKTSVLESAAIMPRYLRFTLIVGALLVCSLQSRAQVSVSLTPPCSDAGILAWGAFTEGTSPSSIKTNCAGTVPLAGISTASGEMANQVAAFASGRGVALEGAVNWDLGNLTVKFPDMRVVQLKVWVLYKRSDCDLACIRLKMSNFLLWANDRLDMERTGIQLIAAGGSADWISDQDPLPDNSPVGPLVAFSESGDCKIVKDEVTIPSSMKQTDALNIYLVKTVGGLNHRGVFCSEARDAGFANGFVASQATNSTILHEISHNLGLSHSAADLNVMNQTIDNGAFFTEGQAFRMNFSSSSIMTIAFGVTDKRDCENTKPEKGCPSDEDSVWPDP